VRLTPEEISKMFLELDMMVYNLLAMMNMNKIQIDEILKPVREHIFAMIVALGFENEYLSLILPPEANNIDEVRNRLYEAFRNYLAKLHGGEKQ